MEKRTNHLHQTCTMKCADTQVISKQVQGSVSVHSHVEMHFWDTSPGWLTVLAVQHPGGLPSSRTAWLGSALDISSGFSSVSCKHTCRRRPSNDLQPPAAQCSAQCRPKRRFLCWWWVYFYLFLFAYIHCHV